eukprot:6187381-Pleurochrysis_carterae.AAC.6
MCDSVYGWAVVLAWATVSAVGGAHVHAHCSRCLVVRRRETLTVLLSLTERGVNPEALAAVVKELRRESAAMRDATAQE